MIDLLSQLQRPGPKSLKWNRLICENRLALPLNFSQVAVWAHLHPFAVGFKSPFQYSILLPFLSIHQAKPVSALKKQRCSIDLILVSKIDNALIKEYLKSHWVQSFDIFISASICFFVPEYCTLSAKQPGSPQPSFSFGVAHVKNTKAVYRKYLVLTATGPIEYTPHETTWQCTTKKSILTFTKVMGWNWHKKWIPGAFNIPSLVLKCQFPVHFR